MRERLYREVGCEAGCLAHDQLALHHRDVRDVQPTELMPACMLALTFDCLAQCPSTIIRLSHLFGCLTLQYWRLCLPTNERSGIASSDANDMFFDRSPPGASTLISTKTSAGA